MDTPLPVSEITQQLNSQIGSKHSNNDTTTTNTNTPAKPQTDTSKYGTHNVTCDGCNSKPVVGYRWKCTKCRDHDICDQCHDVFINDNKLLHVNKLNVLPKDVSAHSFHIVAEGSSFTPIGGAPKQQPTVKKQSKIGPNDTCHCGSGKKYKKCHQLADSKAAAESK